MDRYSILSIIVFCITAGDTTGFISKLLSPVSRCAVISSQPKNTLVHLSSSSNNNNKNDNETPEEEDEERRKRMEFVRKLQKTYYADEKGTAPHRHGTFVDLPLWRVQSGFLPGYQSVIHISEPHYTHMFMRIVSGPKPWYFGHLFLLGGSTNLDNPNFSLNPPSPSSSTSSSSSSSSRTTSAASAATTAPLTGVLMQITDYKQREDDGSLILVVQSLERFRVVEVSESSSSPYTEATVELLPDEELVEANCQGASEAAAQVVEKYSNNLEALSVEEEADVLWGTAKAAAVEESLHLHPLEFRHVPVNEAIASIYTKNGGVGGGLSPLANYDSIKGTLATDARQVVSDAMERYLSEPTPPRPPLRNKSPLVLWGSTSSLSCGVRETMEVGVAELEYDVWVSIDAMIRLLQKACTSGSNNNNNIVVPIPFQILGLIPTKPAHAWPEGFILSTYAEEMAENENALIGIGTNKSPFVLVDTGLPSSYPPLRRAHRLSYAVWVLLDSIQFGNSSSGSSSQQELLELGSICERLEAARKAFDNVNEELRNAVQQNRS